MTALSSPGVFAEHRLVHTGRPSPATVGWLAVAAAVGAAAGLGANAGSGDPAAVALARALIVGAPLAVGLAALRRRAGDRFGMLLVVVGLACLVSTLAESSDPLLYTAGRATGWLVEILLVYVILAFPSGRLPARTDRLIVAAMATVVGLLRLPRLLLAATLQVPSPYTSCVHDCPPNVVALVNVEPALLDALLRPASLLGIALVTAAVVARLVHRTTVATPLARRMYLPVIVLAAVRALLVATGFVGVYLDQSQWLPIVGWLTALSVPAIALAFGAGLLRWRLLRARALRRLAQAIAASHDAGQLRAMLARALEDPRLTIVVPAADGGWIDDRGRRLDTDALGSCALSTVRDDGRVVAAIVHDRTLADEPMLLDAATAMTSAVLANQRLVDESRTAVRELRRSRARIASGAERERRRIEWALRDGAEQRLAALRVAFPLVADLVSRDAVRGLARLRRLEDDVEATLTDIRTLAHGVCPPLLVDRGLVAALRAHAAQTAMPLRVEAHDLGPCRPEVESAVYFCVLEALRQATEHAQPDARAVLELVDGDELRVTLRIAGAVRPQGLAGEPTTGERLTAVGGHAELTVTREGTVLRAVVPAPHALVAEAPGSSTLSGARARPQAL